VTSARQGRSGLSAGAPLPSEAHRHQPSLWTRLGDEVVKHALRLARETGETVAMLLNLASPCHHKRRALWVTHPPSIIFALDELVCWSEGDLAQACSATAHHRHCWVVWKPDEQRGTSFAWLSTAQFKSPTVSNDHNCAITPQALKCARFAQVVNS
jgi:hypothetical protein